MDNKAHRLVYPSILGSRVTDDRVKGSEVRAQRSACSASGLITLSHRKCS